MIKQIRHLLENFINEQQQPESDSMSDGKIAGAAPNFMKATMRTGLAHHQHTQSAPSCNLPVDEVENEAITMASDYLVQNGFPISFALLAARRCVDQDLSVYLSTTVSKKHNDVEKVSISSAGVENTSLGEAMAGLVIEENDELMVDVSVLSTCVHKSIRAYCQKLLSDGNLNAFFEQSTCPKPPYEWNAHAVRNSRRKMEDRHVVVPNVAWLYPNISDADQTAAFAVYDGHGGQECADYARSHCFYHVFHSKSYPNDVCQALKDGFNVTDLRVLKYCEREGRPSGTTAVAAIIKDKTVYVAWAGDSRALIVEQSNVKRLSDPPHDTKDKAELARIEAVGGLVFNFQGQERVNGLLNITRSLGDLALKPTPLTAEPEVTQIQLTGSECCLILASDGMFDGHDWDQVGQLTRDYLKGHAIEEYPNLAKHLVDVACNKTSDNVTVIVVFLKPMERLNEIFH